MTETPHPVPRRGRAFWIGAAAGWGLILYGLRGTLHHSLDTRPAELARFWIGGTLAHDLLVVPAVLGIGIILRRTVVRNRRALQQALIICGPLALFAYPSVRGYGHALGNPTSLPHNYTANLALVAGAVILVVALTHAVRRQKMPATSASPGGSRSATSP